MSTPTHTPGPWTVQQLHADGTIITKGGRFEIVTAEYDVCSELPRSGPIRKLADARLIAAAPDLLAALRKVQPFMRRGTDAEGKLRAIIDAAIAKAEGNDDADSQD